MKKRVFFIIFLIFTTLLIQCSDPVSVPPDIPIEILLASPDTLNIENQNMIQKTYLWRDFQPVSPPGGKPLIALIYIETADSSNISLKINPEVIYIVYNNKIWKSFFSNEERPPSEIEPYRISKIARDGPKWGPKVYVDVIVKIKVGRKYYLLRASDQYISRTD